MIISWEMFANVNGHLFGEVLIFEGWVGLGWGGGFITFVGPFTLVFEHIVKSTKKSWHGSAQTLPLF